MVENSESMLGPFKKITFLLVPPLLTQGVPVIKPMSATAFQSMLHAGKVTGTGERELKKHLTSHLGQGFCPTQRSVNMLSEGHGIFHYGSCQFTSQTPIWIELNWK